jgi:hypothetical protein
MGLGFIYKKLRDRHQAYIMRKETTYVCKYCRTQPATEGVYCDKCLWKVVADRMKRDVITAYQEGVITMEEYLFIFGPATGPLTEADEERFARIMSKVDGEYSFCHGCAEEIEHNDEGLAILFVDKLDNKRVRHVTFVHKNDRCKRLVVGDSSRNWSDSCEPKYISLEQFLGHDNAGDDDLMPSEDKRERF